MNCFMAHTLFNNYLKLLKIYTNYKTYSVKAIILKFIGEEESMMRKLKNFKEILVISSKL